MAHDEKPTNPTVNRPFRDILEKRLSRRQVMLGGLAAAAGFLAAGNGAAATRRAVVDGSGEDRAPGGERPPIDFTPVARADGGGPMPAISADYEYQALIPWGTPLKPGIAEYTGDPATRPSAAQQADMIGIGHDGMWFFPESARGRQSSKSGILCINHEFGRNPHVLGKDSPEDLEDVRLSQHAHGVSVVALEERAGQWRVAPSPLNRRVHVNTPVTFSGPVVASHAGRELLDLNARPHDARGTVNNCSSGHTPWGTYLTCEENFNGYFGATGDWAATEAQKRYGLSQDGFGYGWQKFDARFDLTSQAFAHEDNRFGWVVEIDPQDPGARPIKRTALGRFKHEGATVTEAQDGRIVVYMGDDQRFDYIYKFVSADNWRSMRSRGVSPLDEGRLYAARFDEDGSGEWLELDIGNPLLSDKFSNQAEVLTYARLAADALGATPMDRPEWTSVAPDGRMYCTLTNNSKRTTADAANPLAPNPDGHIIRWRDSEQHTGTTFTWDIFLVAESTHGGEDTFSDPDGIWADPDGRLFIQTDGNQQDGLNNQLLVADTGSGELRRLLTGVSGDEITGLAVTPDRRTLFCNTQHPGNGDPTKTNFPAAPDGITIPRDCTFVIRRRDGGIVGS
ncbi:MAG: PhoX family phosphatase [Halieaceae bacterium]|jgi:secreted PhoX family phosphatase|nr:PhoX family phosphatase [Halieaceae bacterium]